MKFLAMVCAATAVAWALAGSMSGGGLVTRPASRSALWFVSAQGMVDDTFVDDVAGEIAAQLQLPVRTGHDTSAVDGVSVLLEDRRDAVTLTVEPENCRAKVNVRALAADGASAEKLKLRVRKEMWRAAIYLLGGGNSAFQFCVMKPVASLEDLDGLEARMACPEPFNRVLDTAWAFGIRGTRSTSYRRACEEGWAPPPTNDVQTAIWEQVKADKERGPSNAIRILPPKKNAK